MKKTKAKILFLIAVLLELIGNFIISYTDGFTNPVPSVICFLIYSASAVFFGFSLKEINLGIAYAVWSGVGIVFLAIVSVAWFHLPLTKADIIGLIMIIIGVVGMDLYGSKDDQEDAIEVKEEIET
ncbi:MAG: multidrug efflux SMR transporter [Firmicutes bacterium]|nr:multidrug efflux SMR transporter [Bacillota bacterium]